MPAGSAGPTARSSSSTDRWKRWSSASAATARKSPATAAHDSATAHACAQPYGQPRGQGSESAAHAGRQRPRAGCRSAYDQPYQSMARDIRPRARPGGQHRRRRQDRRRAEGPARGTAPSDDVGPAREFDALRKDIERAYSVGLAAKTASKLGARIRAAFGRHPDAVRKDRRQKHQDAAARAGAGGGGARHAGARGDGALGRPPLGRFRPALQQIRGPHLEPVARTHGRSGDRGADRSRSSRSARRSTACPNCCRCARSRRRCARWPAPSIISRASRTAAATRPST